MGSPLILVIEDESSIAENILYALGTEGFSTKHCRTAATARDYLRAGQPDLILLDIGLPDENGLDFARSLKRSAAIPIIFVTARSDEIDRIIGFELGADDYVVKPFSPRELTARIRAVLRRTQPQAPDQVAEYRYGGFLLNREKWTLSFDTMPIILSRYEFLLLSSLIENPGRVFTREQLMDRVWDDPGMSLERTVDSHVKSIRQKLRQVSNGEEYIITHRGVGYSFKEFG